MQLILCPNIHMKGIENKYLSVLEFVLQYVNPKETKIQNAHAFSLV